MSRRPWIATVTALVVLLAPLVASAHSTTPGTVRWVAGESAPTVGLIGDSTLSGVRWADEYGDLERFNFLFDAESCRRTLETSCWSREQHRPRNALTALRDHDGEWGDVLVMMTGYNDSSDGFTDGVEAIVDEARRQGIESVVWLSLRTKGVDYEEPLHLANGSTYRDTNRSLYDLADRSNGYLQIADWASHSAGHPEWFEPDGVHLATAGVVPLTDFIAGQVDVVLSGGTVTPDPMPWEEVRVGDEGPLVVEVQQGLLDAGIGQVDVADGVFGPQTGAAVAEFQRRVGLPGTGSVDQATAVELGLDAAAAVSTTLAPATTAQAAVPPTAATVAGAAGPADRAAGTGSGSGPWWVAFLVVPVLARIARRRRRPDTSAPPSPGLYDHEREPVAASRDRS